MRVHFVQDLGQKNEIHVLHKLVSTLFPLRSNIRSSELRLTYGLRPLANLVPRKAPFETTQISYFYFKNKVYPIDRNARRMCVFVRADGSFGYGRCNRKLLSGHFVWANL